MLVTTNQNARCQIFDPPLEDRNVTHHHMHKTVNAVFKQSLFVVTTLIYYVDKLQESSKFKPNGIYSTHFHRGDLSTLSYRHTYFFVLFFADTRGVKTDKNSAKCKSSAQNSLQLVWAVSSTFSMNLSASTTSSQRHTQTCVMALWCVQCNCEPQHLLTSHQQQQVLNFVVQSRIQTLTDWHTYHDAAKTAELVLTGFCSQQAKHFHLNYCF